MNRDKQQDFLTEINTEGCDLAYTLRVPDAFNLPAGNLSTIAIQLHCADCQRPLHVSYAYQGRERKNVYRCPHCQQLGQIALPGPIVLPIMKT
jgi:hypothetical protein